MRIAFIRTGSEEGVNRHVLSFLDFFSQKGAEVMTLNLREGDLQKNVEKLSEFAPHFVMDVNSTGMIVGKQEDKSIPICDLFGFVHVSIFTDEPLFYHLSLIDARQANNFLPVVCDIKYADSLRYLGVNKPASYITPFVYMHYMKEPEQEKDLGVIFLGPVVDPDLLLRSLLENNQIKEEFLPIFYEVGEFMFRNPESHIIPTFDYIFSMFNPSLQESFLKWREENPDEFIRFLQTILIYASAKKRWYVLSFLEGIDLKIVGAFQGELKEGHQVLEVSSHQDVLEILGRANMSLLVYPHTVPTGVGFSPIECAYMECAPFIDFRGTLPGFFTPEEECITFLPLDRAEIEEKIVYYLDNPQEAREIGKRARQKVLERYLPDDRAEFLYNIFQDILKQAQDVSNVRDMG